MKRKDGFATALLIASISALAYLGVTTWMWWVFAVVLPLYVVLLVGILALAKSGRDVTVKQLLAGGYSAIVAGFCFVLIAVGGARIQSPGEVPNMGTFLLLGVLFGANVVLFLVSYERRGGRGDPDRDLYHEDGSPKPDDPKQLDQLE